VKKVYFIKLLKKEIKSLATVQDFLELKIEIKDVNMFKKFVNN
jgi:hypothetical protein